MEAGEDRTGDFGDFVSHSLIAYDITLDYSMPGYGHGIHKLYARVLEDPGPLFLCARFGPPRRHS